MKLKSVVDTSVTVMLLICATVVTMKVITVEPRRAAAESQPAEVSEWRAVADVPSRFGPDDAPMVITVFSDYECPWCRRFDDTVAVFQAKYPQDVSVAYRHFPLDDIHRAARPAAIAAVCASRQGKFTPYHRKLFDNADSLAAARPWERLASEVAVADGKAFVDCLSSADASNEVKRDIGIGQDIGVASTPTVLINERRYRGFIGSAQLEEARQRLVRQ